MEGMRHRRADALFSMFLADSEWRCKAAAALGRNLYQLPPSKSALKHLLKAAAAAYTRKIVAAARSSGHHFSAQDPARLLGAAVNTGSKRVVAAVLAAFPATAWTLDVVSSFLMTSAKVDKPRIFKLLVRAADAAEVAAVSTATAQTASSSKPAAAAVGAAAARGGSDSKNTEGTRGRMSAALLEAALLHAARAKNFLLVEWVLKIGRPCQDPELLKPSSQELLGVLEGLKDYDAMFRRVVGRAAADKWTAEQLAPLVEDAAEVEKEAAVIALVEKSGVSWRAEHLAPAAKCVAKSCGNFLLPDSWSKEDPWLRDNGGTPPKCNHARVMRVILGAARDQWTEAQLAQLLLPAVNWQSRRVVRVVLGQLVGGWSSQQLWPAVQLASENRRLKYDKWFDIQFTLVDLVKAAQDQWSEEQLKAVLVHATDNGWWGALHGLVGVEGVQLTAEEVQAMSAAVGVVPRVCKAEDVLKYSSMCQSDVEEEEKLLHQQKLLLIQIPKKLLG